MEDAVRSFQARLFSLADKLSNNAKTGAVY